VQTDSYYSVLSKLETAFVRYYEDYEIDEVKGLSNLTQIYIEVFLIAVLYSQLLGYIACIA